MTIAQHDACCTIRTDDEVVELSQKLILCNHDIGKKQRLTHKTSLSVFILKTWTEIAHTIEYDVQIQCPSYNVQIQCPFITHQINQ